MYGVRKYAQTRGVWVHAPQENLQPLKLFVVASQGQVRRRQHGVVSFLVYLTSPYLHSYGLSSSSCGQPKQDVHCEWFYLLQVLPPELQQHGTCVDVDAAPLSLARQNMSTKPSCTCTSRLLCQSLLSHVRMPVVVW